MSVHSYATRSGLSCVNTSSGAGAITRGSVSPNIQPPNRYIPSTVDGSTSEWVRRVRSRSCLSVVASGSERTVGSGSSG
jgi:hypothetical protein